ncbi:MAG: serine hydrolase [Planctomycetes bacterium]|nr:serine hydrolase [Planctomycetota bacterium]
MTIRAAIALFFYLILQSPAVTTEAPVTAPPVTVRAKWVGTIIEKGADVPTEAFDPAFLAAVPVSKLRTLFDTFTFGKVAGVAPRALENNYSGKFFIEFESGHLMPLTIGVTSTPPHRIHTLFVGAPILKMKDWKEYAERFDALGGSSGFIVAKLPADPAAEMEIVSSHNADEPLAIGSAFKLYILGALIEDVANGKHKWTETAELKKNLMSMPSGVLHTWPAGAPLTLHTLATLMISQSDNTATDHLLTFLGRERVESMFVKMGNLHSEKSLPVATTLELFKLKGRGQRDLRKRYIAADGKTRREMLDKDVAPISKDDVDLSQMLGKPLAIDSIEWFASAADLARAMRWILDHTNAAATAPAREILGVNLGVDISRDNYQYAGYKGGSETGVLNLTHVIITKDGARYSVVATWNNPSTAVQTEVLVPLSALALETLGRQGAK